MANFTGTEKEFGKWIGPYCRNLVQSQTRAYKKEIGKCEHCGTTDNLESAHRQGKERPKLIEAILKNYRQSDSINIDMDAFDGRFKKAHQPIELTIIILCKSCHLEYDANSKLSAPNYKLKDESCFQISVEKMLKSVGITTFVSYFDLLRNESISNKQLVDLMKLNEGYSHSSCVVKVSQGKKIIQNDLVYEALEIAENANPNKVPVDIIYQARYFKESLIQNR